MWKPGSTGLKSNKENKKLISEIGRTHHIL